MRTRTAVFPGSFDPITYGHLDVIERGAALFDELVIGVTCNEAKHILLPTRERVRIIGELTAHLGNVTVQTYDGMTVDFVKRLGAQAILRGIRTFSDFEYEFQLALANRRIAGTETVFVMASAENSFIRSTLIKEGFALGGDMSAFVPPQALRSLARHLPRVGTMDRGSGLGGAEPPTPGAGSAGLTGESME